MTAIGPKISNCSHPLANRFGPPLHTATSHVKANRICLIPSAFLISHLPQAPSPNLLPFENFENRCLKLKDLHDIRSSPSPRQLDLKGSSASAQERDHDIGARRRGCTSWKTEQLETKGHCAPKYHATSRPQIVGTEATDRAIALSHILDVPTLIVQTPTHSSGCLRPAGANRGAADYADTCPQCLFLARSDLNNPRIRGRQMRLFTAAP